jgi:hypothetical protein
MCMFYYLGQRGIRHLGTRVRIHGQGFQYNILTRNSFLDAWIAHPGFNRTFPARVRGMWTKSRPETLERFRCLAVGQSLHVPWSSQETSGTEQPIVTRSSRSVRVTNDTRIEQTNNHREEPLIVSTNGRLQCTARANGGVNVQRTERTKQSKKRTWREQTIKWASDRTCNWSSRGDRAPVEVTWVQNPPSIRS